MKQDYFVILSIRAVDRTRLCPLARPCVFFLLQALELARCLEKKKPGLRNCEAGFDHLVTPTGFKPVTLRAEI